MHLYARRWLWRGLAVTIAVFLVLLSGFGLMVNRYAEKNREREAAQIKTALRRAAVTCFAVEGRYPPSLEYLKAHYGVVYSEENYLVDYEIFASNVTPLITVLERGRKP